MLNIDNLQLKIININNKITGTKNGSRRYTTDYSTPIRIGAFNSYSLSTLVEEVLQPQQY